MVAVLPFFMMIITNGGVFEGLLVQLTQRTAEQKEWLSVPRLTTVSVYSKLTRELTVLLSLMDPTFIASQR